MPGLVPGIFVLTPPLTDASADLRHHKLRVSKRP
jgi:hypothetical protein